MLWFRCILVGLVTTIIASCFFVVGEAAWYVHSFPAPYPAAQVGFDVVTMWHNWGVNLPLLTFAAIAFAVGFLLAYRSYSRLRAIHRA